MFSLSIPRLLQSASVLFLASLLALPQSAMAQVFSGGGMSEGLSAIAGISEISKQTSITGVVLIIIAFILEIALILAVAAIIIAGIYLIVSNGEEGQKDKAKKIILYVIIGIIVILLARVIVLFIASIL